MLIGLSGRAGVGKDTVASLLVSNYGFKRYAFADAVRKAALAIDPLVMAKDEATRLSMLVASEGWDTAKRSNSEVRKLLQKIGSMGRDILGINCWLNIVWDQWVDDEFPNAVITDLRFPNEYYWITDEEGVTIKIERPDNPDAIPVDDISEKHQFQCTHTLVNDSDLKLLKLKVDSIMSKYTL